MSAPFVPAVQARPETFAVRAADHIDRGRRRGHELSTGIDSALSAYRRFFSHLSIAEVDVTGAAASSHARLPEWAPTAAGTRAGWPSGGRRDGGPGRGPPPRRPRAWRTAPASRSPS